jgi:hypothetical protein
MQGALTFVTMTFAAAFQIAFLPGAVASRGPCGTADFQRSLERGPSLEQRLSNAGLPELSEAFGLHVADTPQVLVDDLRYPRPRSPSASASPIVG